MERLTFNVGSGRTEAPVLIIAGGPTAAPARPAPVKTTAAALRERYDWDYVWMLAFTALLFFRPQDHIPALTPLHLAELTAIAGLAAMAARRMAAGQTIARVNAEVVGVVMLGAVILGTVPFSFWPSGALAVFTDIYVKIILIFALMISTLTTPRRVRQMTWLMIVASGYIAFRAVLDAARGVNMAEGNRVRGVVGGMFENPNDLALNLVTFLAPTIFIVLRERRTSRRLFALGIALVMVAAIVATKSRSGFVGLLAMGLVALYYVAKTKPGVIFAVIFAGVLALPMAPQSFWDRMSSITDPEADPTGSRAARIRLFNQGIAVFVENPLTGVGAGQFQNYDGPMMVERWRVTHNVWLQVAADLGIFGLLTFAFLVFRGFSASLAAQRALRAPRRKFGAPPARAGTEAYTTLSPDEQRIIDINAKGMFTGLAGWFACAFFASVAFNWTFYYVFALAVAGRDVAQARRLSAAAPRASEPERLTA